MVEARSVNVKNTTTTTTTTTIHVQSSNSRCGKREAFKKWSMVNLKRQYPLLELLWRPLGTQVRDLINKGLI